MAGTPSTPSSRFYAGLSQRTDSAQSIRRQIPVRGQRSVQPPGSSGDINQHDLLKLLEEQKETSKELRKQNNGLLLLTAKISKELKELKQQTTTMQQNASEIIKSQVVIQLAAQTDKQEDTRRRKPRLPLPLSRKVRALHSSQEPENQFKGTERFSSEHNQRVADTLIVQLVEDSEEFSEVDVRRAVHRHYESKRKNVLDALPERRRQVICNKTNAKRKGFRTRLYHRRLRAVRSDDERRAWLELSYAYMTEESESEEGIVRQHKLTWTSHSMFV